MLIHLEQIKFLLDNVDYSTLDRIARLIVTNTEKKFFILGNGGSAYSASHFAQDLVKACRINAESLTDNVGLVTAISNDISYPSVFTTQLEVKSTPDDIIFAISCSGNSGNILEVARLKQNFLVSFTANDGGLLAKLSNININVPTENIYIAEGIHSMLLHYIIERVLEYENEPL